MLLETSMISCHRVALPVNMEKGLRLMSAPHASVILILILKAHRSTRPIMSFSIFSKKYGGPIHRVPVALCRDALTMQCYTTSIGERS